MAFQPRDLRWMVEESTTLSERIGGTVVPGGSGRSARAAGARLRKWRDRVANGDAERFEKRLRWDGLDNESALRLLGAVSLKDAHRLPDWARLLDAAAAPSIRETAFDRAVASRNVFDPQDPQPFEDLLWRLIAEAGGRLLASLGTRRERLSSAALVDLARGLLGRLCRTAARTLCVEFDAFRALGSGRLSFDQLGPASDGRRLYRDFVRAMSGKGMAGWLLRYPMLGRLLATCCRQWVAATSALVTRLDHDEGALRSTFGFRDRRLEIVGVAPDLSDPHREGRTVCAIRLASGARLVYKPRRLALDRRFSSFLQRIDDLHPDLALKRLRVLDRAEYGWLEWAEAAPCPDLAAVERFYRRAGMLTCLAYVLGASDLHAGNLIASGDQPVPIDLECLVGAPVASSGRAVDPAHRPSPPGSVLRTGLPPAARSSVQGVFRIAGGLADPDSRQAPGHPVANANTDGMAWRGRPVRGGAEPNAPVLNGRRQSASAHVEPLIEGFRLMYRTLSRNKGRLKDADEVRRLEREEFRVLVRDTRSYAALRESALSPLNLTSGPDWSIALDVLVAPELAASERPRCWATRIAERVELERLDVPLFVGRMDRRGLRSALGTRLDERLDRTGYAVSSRLDLLNPADLEQQIHLLRMSFAIAEVKRRFRERRVRAIRAPGRSSRRPDSHAGILVEVHSIVALLKRLAVDQEPLPTWRGLVGPAARTATIAPVGPGLFSGTAGIALFLATAAAVTGRRDARALAARVFDALCERLGAGRAFPADPASDLGIGGATGVGGLIYALVNAGRSLARPDYLAAASTTAGSITAEVIRADNALDVLSGTAGALLGLLALHRTTGDASALQTAIRCGEHLLDSRTTDPRSGLRSWRRRRGRVAHGFAHGTSGIGCALRRLGNVTGTYAFRSAAAEGWSAERRRTPEHRVARSARRPTTHHAAAAWSWSWCRGAAGMGLARLEALDDDQARSDLEAALDTAPGEDLARTDGLCCGRLGRADFLLTAGLRFGRRDLREAAETICRETVARALAEGRYATGADEGLRPGLFQGIAGIGYELLRMQAPAVARSVLLWE